VDKSCEPPHPPTQRIVKREIIRCPTGIFINGRINGVKPFQLQIVFALRGTVTTLKKRNARTGVGYGSVCPLPKPKTIEDGYGSRNLKTSSKRLDNNTCEEDNAMSSTIKISQYSNYLTESILKYPFSFTTVKRIVTFFLISLFDGSESETIYETR